MFKLIRILKPSEAHSTGNWTICTLKFQSYPTSSCRVQKKGKVLFQSQQHQRGVHEIGLTNYPNVIIDEVKAVVTLRSGKELRPAAPALIKSAPTVADPPQEEQSVSREEVKISIPPPFPQALRKKKSYVNQMEMLEVLRQVKVNIPLLDMIK